MFKPELDSLQRTYTDRFLLHYVFSQKWEENDYTGRINVALIQSVLSGYGSNFNVDEVFLCGQEAMIDMAKEYFIKQGLTSEQIHFELFSVTKEPKDEVENFSGEAEVTIILDDESTTFKMQQRETVLAAALKHGLDAPYSCQGGICSSCLAKLTSGKVKMDNNRILSQEELEEGLILTCQSHPVSEKITVNYDNV
ncbi:MAG: iron-sulfur cluster-binding domain-containing protein [Flavobacteriaceae bacterium]|nr:iron-sulfur cluster-binding domain-containing protein [Flavobacteriaceae bacterium]